MRLRKSWEYLAVKKKGIRFKDKSFWLQIVFNQDSMDLPKLGVIASRRYGGAIARNRAKRRLREVFRKNISDFPLGSRIVILPRPDLFTFSFQEIEKKILFALAKISIVR
jgi:ribonuclease P protein component